MKEDFRAKRDLKTPILKEIEKILDTPDMYSFEIYIKCDTEDNYVPKLTYKIEKNVLWEGVKKIDIR